MEKVIFGEDENRMCPLPVSQAPLRETEWLTSLAYDYERPLSRAAVTTIMRAYSTPSIAI